MKRTTLRLAAICSLVFTLNTSAAVLYVELNSTNPVSPYTSWATAAVNIQDAVDAANPGDQVLVTNGVYQGSGSGGNRVAVNQSITVQSVNGPEVTVIDGAGAMRCVYLANGTALSGFTLKNGSSSGNGGGVLCQSTSATLSNCVVTANLTQDFGSGGGEYSGTLNNCVITGNSARLGGGVSYGTLNNCTIIGNYATNDGGGTYYGNLTNCIIYYNTIGHYLMDNYAYPGSANYCCTTPLYFGSGNITNAPAFVDLAAGNLRLQIGSPCINAGTNAFAPAGPDLDGNPRIAGGTVDMGAYENQYTSPVHYVSLSSTNPAPPYTNWSTAATNIQDAVGVALAGELVVADAGVYSVGGTVIYGQETNRVALTNAVTLLSVYGPQMTTIVGGTQTRCVYVGSNSILSGFTLTNGQTRYFDGDVIKEQSGGGIWCESSGAVTNCWIVGNSALYSGQGGGIYGGTVYGSVLMGNSAKYGGGAFSNTAWNCTFSSNSASYGGGAASAGLFNCTMVSNGGGWGAGVYQGTLSNCTLVANGNYTATGGGAYQSILFNCTLLTNYSGYGAGGAQYSELHNCTLKGNYTSWSSGGTDQCTNYSCTLQGNFGYWGGGVSGGIAYNCMVISNTASYQGGGAYQGTLVNCTVVGNTATNGGGGVYGGTLDNSIIYYNSSPGGSNWSGSPGLYYCCTAPDPFSVGNVTNGPLFVDAAVGDFRLKCGSPCIDAGFTNFLILGATNDFRGVSRPLDGDGDGIAKIDMGACEYNPAMDQIPAIRALFAFTNFAANYPVSFAAEIGGCADYFWWDFGDGVTVTNQSPVSHAWASPGQYNVRLSAYYSTLGQSLSATMQVQVVQQPVYYVSWNSPIPRFPYTNWTTAAHTVQQAIGAGTATGRLILVADGVYQSRGVIVYGYEYNAMALTNPVVVQSVNGPGATTIQLSYQGRCAYVGSNAFLIGFTLTGGQALYGGDIYKELSGGGVWCEPGGVVSNCVVAGNSAVYYGGGAYQGTFYNCVFTNNSVGGYLAQGGGVFGGILYNCIVISNSLMPAGVTGGGVSQSTLYNCILTGNSANQPRNSGGGAYLSTLYNCTMSGNSAYYGGGANLSTLYGCTVLSNSANFGGGGCSNKFWNCVLAGNHAGKGGGAFMSTLYNCLVVSNQASTTGGGLCYSTPYNCTVVKNAAADGGGIFGSSGPDVIGNNIIYCNAASNSGDNWQGGFHGANNCTFPRLPFPPAWGNITNDPMFMDAAFHLSATSPCRGTGSSLFATGADLDGEAWNNPPSMGADEVYDADFIGALSVTIQSPQTNLLVNHSLALAGQITGRAAGLEWSFDDGTILTNVSYFTTHVWTNSGDYSVIFTAYNTDNPGGVSTNLVIHVLPLAQPWLQPTSFSMSPDGFQFQFNGQADAIYTVQVATNLIPPIVWQDLQTITSTGGVVQVTDPNTPNGMSFYRVGVQ